VFGGFTPVPWEPPAIASGPESRFAPTGQWRGDASGQSFLFALNDPQGGRILKWSLDAKHRGQAVFCGRLCGRLCGPAFGIDQELYVGKEPAAGVTRNERGQLGQ
jgi:hypothetical protein